MITLLIANPNGEPFRFSVPNGAVVRIGRNPRNTVIIPDRHVSQFHAELHFDAAKGRFVLKDLHSHNGTRVNGELVKEEAIVNLGDRIVFGKLEAVLIAEKPVVSLYPSTPLAVLPEESTKEGTSGPSAGEAASAGDTPEPPPVSVPIKELIARLDLIDQLITRYGGRESYSEVVNDLRVLRTSFHILLQRSRIEPFSFEPKTKIDLPLRTQIEIVGTADSPAPINGTPLIAATLQSGYLYRREGSEPIILRKARVTTWA